MVSIIWAIAGYFTSKKIAKLNPQLEINPWLYGVGSLLFSYLGTMSYLGYKVCDSKDNKNGKIFAIIGIVVTVLINAAIIFGEI